MGLLAGLIELLAPTRCSGCELPGSLLCDDCDRAMLRVEAKYACPRCAAPYGYLVCTECWSSELAFEQAIALGELDGVLARAVVLHKDAGERRLGAVLGGLLGGVVHERWSGFPQVVTWIPPTTSALARRGFDHGRSLAEPVASVCSAGAEQLLSRRRARDQRRMGRLDRQASAGGSFEVSTRPPSRVLLVDDVMTTGATLDAASQALLEAGAKDVRVAVVARAW